MKQIQVWYKSNVIGLTENNSNAHKYTVMPSKQSPLL